MTDHWTEKLFLEDPELFKVFIEDRLEKTDSEIEALLQLFSEYNVSQDGLILDLACGIGRISIPLAKEGYNVVGLDFSPSYIQDAIEYAEKEGVSENTRFIEGDIRQAGSLLREYMGKFDVVLNMWTSMGYWDEETDVSILTQSQSLTQSGGVFIMHTVNRDRLIKKLQGKDFVFRDDGLVILMDQALDLEKSRVINYWTYYRKEGEDLHFLKKVELDHRVYSIHELKKQFQDSGWSYLASYGGFDLRPLTSDCFSMIVVTQKQ
jgi:SAM-dependent methyltransferase